MLRITAAILILLTAAAQPAAAAGKGITEDMINAQYDQMAKVLNNRQDAIGKIRYLHDIISDDASFKMTVTNPSAPASGKSPVVELDKTAYINSYLQGIQFVNDYSVDIQAVKFEPGETQNVAYTLDVMTERGLMMSALNDGKPFVSRTTCRTRHELRDGRLLDAAGECHTDISFEEEI